MRYRIRGIIQQGLRITQSLSVAQHVTATRDYSPRCSKNIYAEQTCGHENTIRWDTNSAFAVFWWFGGWFFPLLFPCFKSGWAKFFLACFCRSRAEFVEHSITTITEESKSLRDARPHPQGATPGFATTWTCSSPSGCSFTQ